MVPVPAVRGRNDGQSHLTQALGGGCAMWRSWLWGLAPFVLLTSAALSIGGPAIEADLSSRAMQSLAGDGQGWAQVTVSGRDLFLIGEAPTPMRHALALAALARVPGLRLIHDRSTPLPTERPYAVTLEHDGEGLTLAGFAPSLEAKTALIDAARLALPEAKLIDRLQLAAGAPDGLDALTGLGLSLLTKLDSGRVAINDAALSVDGVAPTREALGATQRLLAALPEGTVLAANRITAPPPPPYVWCAELGPSGLTFSGSAPSEIVRAALIERAGVVLGHTAVTDRMEIAPRADDAPFRDTALALIGQFARFATARVQIRDDEVTISGEARDFSAYDAALAAAQQSLPQGFRLTSLTVLPARAEPFGWTATHEPGGITLSGFVPSNEARRAVIAAARARFPTAAVIDQMRLASGAPQGEVWTANVIFALTELARLKLGRVTIVDRVLSLSGEAASPEVRDTSLQALQRLPDGLRSQTSAIAVFRRS